jgi:hypothetical protein
MLVKPLPLPVNTPVFAVKFTAVIVPLTFNPVNVPTLVMLGCAFVVNVPVSKVALRSPVDALNVKLALSDYSTLPDNALASIG